jgi:hypothetical protein
MDSKFEAKLGYIVRPCLKKPKPKERKEKNQIQIQIWQKYWIYQIGIFFLMGERWDLTLLTRLASNF